MILAAAILLAMLVMAAAPDAPVSKILRRFLVERPAAFLAKGGASKLLGWLILAAILLAVLRDGSQIAGAAGGLADAVPTLTALIDGSLTLDILATLALVVASGSLKAVWRLVMSMATRLARLSVAVVRLARRRPRSRRKAGQPPRRPDDASPEPGWGRRLAFA